MTQGRSCHENVTFEVKHVKQGPSKEAEAVRDIYDSLSCLPHRETAQPDYFSSSKSRISSLEPVPAHAPDGSDHSLVLHHSNSR
jgi:hypothetical protein